MILWETVLKFSLHTLSLGVPRRDPNFKDVIFELNENFRLQLQIE